MDLSSPREISEKMRVRGLRFNKSLGQNFLIDKNILGKIVAEVPEGSTVIEIGPGMGSLTQALAERAGRVIAIEIDRNLAQMLDGVFPNVEVIDADVMQIELPPADHVVANLPYYITTPIIMKLLEWATPQNCQDLKSITIMIQKEVAERICAVPGGKAYGALTLAVQYHATAKLVCRVPARCFMPPPKVDSCVVRMELRDEPPVPTDKDELFRLIRAGFGQRRKTLLNAVCGIIPKDELKVILNDMGLDERVRAERLSLQDFATILGRINVTPRGVSVEDA